MSHSDSHTHAHHFQSAAHEFDSCKQGMWLFLLQEVLFFSGLFVAYGIFRGLYPDMVKQAHHALDWKLGGLNTLVLITSSVTMVMAVSGAMKGDKKATFRFSVATFLLACVFLVIKYVEYSHKFHLGLLPGSHFHYHGDHPVIDHPKAPLFFSVYFMMTGVHGIHVIGGMIYLLFWILPQASRGEFGPHNFTRVELFGLYWHFVDLVWIYLFPLLYLVG